MYAISEVMKMIDFSISLLFIAFAVWLAWQVDFLGYVMRTR